MLLWPIKEALGVAFHVHTDLAWEFHQAAIDLVIQHAKASFVSRAEHNDLVEQLNDLRRAIQASRPALEMVATAAGTVLQAQRGVKHLRLVGRDG